MCREPLGGLVNHSAGLKHKQSHHHQLHSADAVRVLPGIDEAGLGRNNFFEFFDSLTLQLSNSEFGSYRADVLNAYISMSTTAFTDQSYDSWVVGTVRVVVHNLGPVKPGAAISYNHWTVSLLVAQNKQTLDALGPQKSVRLDMRPEGPRNGDLRISLLDYLITNNATQYFDFKTAADRKVTVGTVKILVRSRGRHRYTMTEHGGCQWWCWNVISDLAQAGHIAAGAADQLATVLKNNYSVTLPPMAHNIELGTFY